MTFITGQSGNEKGRPPGIVDKRAKLRQLFEPHAEKLIEKVVELALAGDINALKICLDPLVPKVKDNGESDRDESIQRTLERINEARRQYDEY